VGDKVRWVAPARSGSTSSSMPSFFLPKPRSLRLPLASRLSSSAGLLSRMRGVAGELVSVGAALMVATCSPASYGQEFDGGQDALRELQDAVEQTCLLSGCSQVVQKMFSQFQVLMRGIVRELPGARRQIGLNGLGTVMGDHTLARLDFVSSIMVNLLFDGSAFLAVT
jgi:hypothetical protein